MAAPRFRTAGMQLSSFVSARSPVASSSKSLRPVLNVAGPSSTSTPRFNQQRALSSTPPQWKKSTKTPASNSRASKPKSRTEVENIDYEDPGLDQTLVKVGGKMEKAVEWARSIVFESVERGRGRVSPSLLDSVKVTLPDQGTIPLTAVASVTIKQGTLYVEVWDTDAMKHVESALHKSNLPGLTPQKMGANTFKLPVPRPTGDTRAALAKTVATTVETAKQQVRLARTDGLKAVGGKNTEGADEVQELADKWGGELDEMLVKGKKELEKA